MCEDNVGLVGEASYFETSRYDHISEEGTCKTASSVTIPNALLFIHEVKLRASFALA